MVQGEHNSPGAKKVWVSLGPARVRAWLLVILSGAGRLETRLAN